MDAVDLAPVDLAALAGASADKANESIPYPPPSRQQSKPTVSLGLMPAPWPPPALDAYAPISGYTRLSRA